MKRSEPPSPGDYENLRHGADGLRETDLSGRSRRHVKRRRLQSGMQNYIRYTGIGLQFVLMMLLPIGAGYLLDDWLGTSPWLLLTGAALGGVGAMVYVVYSVFRMEDRSKRDGKKQ